MVRPTSRRVSAVSPDIRLAGRMGSGLLLCGLLALLACGPAQADTLELCDGRIVEGAVFEAEGGLWVLSRFGPRFLKSDEVQARHAGPPVDDQVRAHLAQMDPEDTANRARLAQWLQGIGRDEEALLLAEQVIERDPEDAVARGVLGHVRHRGEWVSPDEAKRRDGFEKHGERWYTPEEWRAVAEAERAELKAAEVRAAQERMAADVNRYLALLMSPDPALRTRARARLEALAGEMEDGGTRLREAMAGVEAYVRELDGLREQAAAAAEEPAGGTVSEGGFVMGEIRATFSRLKRPIPVFVTSLASGPVGANSPVRIQLPELEVIKVRTTGIIPAVVK